MTYRILTPNPVIQSLIGASLIGLASATTPAKANAIPIVEEFYSGDSYAFEFLTPTNVNSFDYDTSIKWSDVNLITGLINPNGYNCQNVNNNDLVSLNCISDPGDQTNSGFGGLSLNLEGFGYDLGTTTQDIVDLYGTTAFDINFNREGNLTDSDTINFANLYGNQVAAVPIGSTLPLFASGLVALVGFQSRKKQNK